MTRFSSWRWVAAAAIGLGFLGSAAAQQAGPKTPAPGAAGKGAAKTAPPVAAAGGPVAIDVKAVRGDFLGADVDKAVAAAQRLGLSRSPEALDALLDGLALGLHPKVAQAALVSVGAMKNAAAVDVLLGYAKHRSPEVRAAALGALGRLDDKRARAAVAWALHDGDRSVRAAACRVIEDSRDRSAAEPLVALLKKGEDAAVPALAAIATPELARRLGELVGEAPDDLLARTLGLMLLRPDFGKEESYVEVVATLAKVPGEEAVVVLTNFISATPEKPPRLSRRKAQEVVDQRLTGGQ
jgi:HEAT repeat protein